MNSNEEAYPCCLRTQEENLLNRCGSRPGGGARVGAQFGLALSGGGIRSATFAFGVLQALARNRILMHVDVLSTVSGGGYTGSLLMRLFGRKEVRDHDDVRRAILPAGGSSNEESSNEESSNEESSKRQEIESGAVLRWLRNNGWYLAPTGSGDLLLAAAILVRNWLSVQFVLVTLVLALFVLLQLFRDWAHLQFPDGDGLSPAGCVAATGSFASLEAWLTCHLPLGERYLWWSPWVLAPTLFLAWVAVPFMWVYWLAADYGSHKGTSWVGAFLPGVLLGVAHATHLVNAVVASAVFVSWLVALCIFCGCAWASRFIGAGKDPDLRNWLSRSLKAALVATGFLLAIALIDTVGQTVYAVWLTPGDFVGRWLATLGAGVVGLSPLANRLAQYFGGEGRTPRFRPAWSLVATIGAVALVTGWLAVINVAAHGIAWGVKYPQHVPGKLVVWRVVKVETCDPGASPCPPLATLRCADCIELGERHVVRTGTATAILWILSLFIGRCWSFLNNSTLLPLYTARLTRAYLGASNPRRLKRQETEPVTRVLADDDVSMAWGRWTRKPDDQLFEKGPPLHLINVTINETLDAKVQLQRKDRKGIGMAVGPAGISAGVRHHVVFRTGPAGVAVHPRARDGFRMFDYGEAGASGARRGQTLSLGQWAGISGAAFSTGLGSRTRLAYSFLAGFFNVRLGYWWDSGVEPGRRCKRAKRTGWAAGFGRRFACVFPVQSYLVDEFLGRFHGTARQYWCLTDGGHFDNTGAYELVRRRLPLMVIIDAEADPDYTYEGLGNLVRKVRSDFGAEIEFLREDEIRSLSEESNDGCRCLRYVGTLKMLRREGDREQEKAAADGREQEGTSERRWSPSRAHAAVARVTYRGEPKRRSILVYVKPTLLGNEPADITQYHASNPDFPHEPTVDQFFDESQWESYRKLGEIIGERVLGEGDFDRYRKEAGLA